ncbi:uncharacterized protein SAMN02745883_01389 [Caminicella sporogenes DSM 14501]|uniref:S1 motif domain-containing protein n=1 Tax=Caminicella sporogenes DSM 14501 TaxID=1121266 RepID=A0A1M6Q4L0_9FIRM|nr:Tex family protein [Caminicella sporogenes]RKD23572.1 RNA-binding transcriptional accessory protein [Caminicella sporogenes]SHK15165.1 uncharacterized protein SAMN02745883_01389 [Caminicella sporogenes DSM 14501]
MELVIKQLMNEFKLKEFQVKNTIKLIDDGNTIPFIARYRKEQTGNLSDVILRDFFDRLTYLRNLKKRKEEVIKSIASQEKLTDELKEKILSASTITEVEDLYRPFRPKRRTRATIAMEKGLEPLAKILLEQNIFEGSIEKIAKEYVNKQKEVNSIDEALQGAMDIIAEIISDDAENRKMIRNIVYSRGLLVSSAIDEEAESVYDMYYKYSEEIKKIPSHRILAINRGEKEKVLRVKIEAPHEEIVSKLKKKIMLQDSITRKYVEMAVEDSYKRLIFPSIEREIRNMLTEKAQEQAIKVFALNLKSLLLQSPVKGKVVMGFDPAYRTGCKIAIVDETGKLLDTTTVYPTPPQNEVDKSKEILKDMIEKYKVDIIAIGNGTASRESEVFVADMIKEIDREVYYTIISEAGASVYSASKLANEEYPDINVSLRGAISIARRLQDPLAEFVKIDPKHIGVGQYQHDVNQKRLSEVLTGVVEDVVNSVGVDLNTASVSLLSYVAGISKSIAKNIVKYRDENGKFKNRSELLKVSRLGPATFEQAAGFLRIIDGENVLDSTAVHPESYEETEKMLNKMGYSLEDIKNGNLKELKEKIEEYGIEKLSEQLNIGILTLKDIIEELLKPGRDPRDEMPKPIFRSDVLKIEDLKPDMILTGTVSNVTDFGAFVDIGIKNDGLVHISEMSERFVKNPMDIVSVGDIIKVRVLNIDVKKGRVSLSMKKA